MDFWSRLLGGTGVARQSTPANPQQRLARFKRTYDQIRTTYQRSPLLQSNSTAAETIRTSFQRLTTLIQDEARAPEPHLCLQFAASAQIYSTISRIGAVAQHEGIIREAVSVFGALLDSEEDEFLSNSRFAHALMVFVDRTSGSGNLFVGEDTECEIVELLFGIAAKIRLQPEILPIWFSERDQARRGSQTKESDFVGVTSKEDFPLCYQLIDHVHHEGRMGDFARTGLLYIFESASKSKQLERWIVASDMPTLMATGLGALYSQLSRKLSILHPPEDIPIILALSDYKQLKMSEEAEGLYSEYVQNHLATFLSYLTFWQDVLEHCRSLDVRQTLLDHLQVLFLQQLLYPSMLESSDVDGGSSVAVLTYTRQILDALDHTELVNLVLQYLLALPEQSAARSTTALKRKSSLMLLTQPENEDDRMNPTLFSLIDLLLSSVTSENPQTVVSALKLATIILSKDHPYAIDTLVKTNPASHADVVRTHGALDAEVEIYMSLAESIAGSAGLDEAYDSHLKDSLRLIESHMCSSKFLELSAITGSTATKPLPNPVGPHPVTSHTVRLDDAFMNKLLSQLKTFLTNNVELNLALTEAFITLFTCPNCRLEGWTAVDPAFYEFSNLNASLDKEDDAKRSLRAARSQPTWSTQHTPALLSVLQSLTQELETLRHLIPDFDLFVTSRKQAFRLHSEISEAIQNAPVQTRASRRSQEGTNPSSPTPSQQPTFSSQVQQRFLDAVSPSPSRSQSRGRPSIADRRGVTSSPAPVRRSGGAGILSQYAPGLASPTSTTTPSRSRQRGSETMARGVSDAGSSAVGGLGAEPKQLLNDVLETANDERLQRRITFPLTMNKDPPQAKNSDGLGISSSGQADGSAESTVVGDGETLKDEAVNAVKPSQESEADNHDAEHGSRQATLSHILTNAVVLQEFVLEIVALMQVRASMFNEVKFA